MGRAEVPSWLQRRRWIDEEKLRLLSVDGGGISVAGIALRSELCLQQLCSWRGAVKGEAVTMMPAATKPMPILPVDVPIVDYPPRSRTPKSSRSAEMVLAEGRRLARRGDHRPSLSTPSCSAEPMGRTVGSIMAGRQGAKAGGTPANSEPPLFVPSRRARVRP